MSQIPLSCTGGALSEISWGAFSLFIMAVAVVLCNLSCVATICHGLSGTLWQIIGALVLEGQYERHVVQLLIISSISFPIPGQNMISRAFCLHFSMLRWLACMCDRMSVQILVGMMIFSPLKIIQFMCESSSSWFQNSDTLCGHFLFSSGQPLNMTPFNAWNCRSLSVWATNRTGEIYILHVNVHTSTYAHILVR